MQSNIITVLIVLVQLFVTVICCNETCTVRVYSITTLANTLGLSVIPGWKIAINEINNNDVPSHIRTTQNHAIVQ